MKFKKELEVLQKVDVIGAIIKEQRKNHGMTQVELAKELGFVPTCIANYESGRNQPGIRELKKLSQIFGVSVDYLVGNTSGVKNEIHADLKKIADHFGNLQFIKAGEKLSECGSVMARYFLVLQGVDFQDKEEVRKNLLEKMTEAKMMLVQSIYLLGMPLEGNALDAIVIGKIKGILEEIGEEIK